MKKSIEDEKEVFFEETFGDNTDDNNSNYDDAKVVEDDDEVDASPIIQTLRKVYDAIFFYGLDPPLSSQKKNKLKLMKDAEIKNSMGVKRNNSPFFTTTEQRVQRYMSDPSPIYSPRKSSDSGRRSNTVSDSGKSRVSNSQEGSTGRSSNTEMKNVGETSLTSQLKFYEDQLVELNETLEVIEAEMLTVPANLLKTEMYRKLKRRREEVLDNLEDINVTIVSIEAALIDAKRR